MKTHLFRTMLLISTIAILPNCKKDKKEEKGPLDYLTKRTWKRATTDKNLGPNPLLNVYLLPSDCEKDDVYTFNVDGTLKIDNGTEKCEVIESKTETGFYNIEKAEITIKGVKYFLAEATDQQIKYFSLISSQTGYYYAVILLQ